jgi:hypothetical protein
VRERDSHRLARFPTRFAGDAHCGEGRRGSDELWTTATLRRDAEEDGELECVINLLDCFQVKMRATTGGLLATRCFGYAPGSSFGCGTRHVKGQGGAPGRGRKVRRGEGVRGSPTLADFTAGVRRDCGVRRVICAAWRRAERGEGGGKAERATGYL